MQYYYGARMVHRVLDEAKLWKQQEAEHTVVIRKLVSQNISEVKTGGATGSRLRSV